VLPHAAFRTWQTRASALRMCPLQQMPSPLLPRPSLLCRLEWLLAIFLLALTLWQTGRMMHAMASTSITTDEYGTVLTFAARGPQHVATDYRAPKNHIFFNLLNALLPGSDSLLPTRARLLSLIAVGLAIGGVIAFTASTGRLLEGALALSLLSFSPKALELAMQARGYGFLLLFGVVCAIAVIEFLRSGRSGWLWALGAASVAGVYTVPNFLFFCGPLLLLTWVSSKKRAVFFTGLATGILILLCYAPVATQFVQAFRDFQADPEMDFQSVDGVIRSIQLYACSSQSWEAWFFLLLLGLNGILPQHPSSAIRSGARIVLGAAVIFFGIVLILKTPPVRVTAFAAFSFVFAGILALGDRLRIASPASLRIVVVVIAAILVGKRAISGTAHFEFLPAEDWMTAGRVADAAFPPSVNINYKDHAKYLGHWIATPEERSCAFDEAAYLNGRLVVVDAANKWAGTQTFLPPQDDLRNAEIRIPGSTRDVVFFLRLPSDSGIQNAPIQLVDGKVPTGADVAPGITLQSPPVPGGLHSLVILFNRSLIPGELNIDFSSPSGDKQPEIAPLVAGNALIIPLKGETREIQLKLTSGDAKLRALEAWTCRK